MNSVTRATTDPQPTHLAPLPRLLAYAQTLGLDRYLARPKRGVSTLAFSVIWLVLAWHGTGRPARIAQFGDPLFAVLAGLPELPSDQTLYRSLSYFSAHDLRRAVETSYRATLPRRGRRWIALDSHHLPYYGRGRREQFQKGWSGRHGRGLRGYRLFLAVDTETGQIVTYLLVRGGVRDHQVLAVLARRVRAVVGRRLAGVLADCGFTTRPALKALAATGIPFILGFARSAPIRQRLKQLTGQQRRWLREQGAVRLGLCPWDLSLELFVLQARTPTDHRGPWVYVTNLRHGGPQQWADWYRRRGRVEQTIDELLNGHDLEHLVTYRLGPNRIAVGFRLLARNLALGLQLAAAAAAAPAAPAIAPAAAPDEPPAPCASPASSEPPAPAAPTAPAAAAPAPGQVVLREPPAFRAQAVVGLGLFVVDRRTVSIRPLARTAATRYHLPWARIYARVAA